MGDQLETLRRRLEQEPDDPECLFALGMEYARIGQDDRAIAHLDLATNLDPEFVDAWIQKAACQHRSRDLHAASRSLETAADAALDADNAQAMTTIMALKRQLEQG